MGNFVLVCYYSVGRVALAHIYTFPSPKFDTHQQSLEVVRIQKSPGRHRHSEQQKPYPADNLRNYRLERESKSMATTCDFLDSVTFSNANIRQCPYFLLRIACHPEPTNQGANNDEKVSILIVKYDIKSGHYLTRQEAIIDLRYDEISIIWVEIPE